MADNSVVQNTVRLIRVFVASPGDVREERSRVRGVIDRVNERHALHEGILLEPWLWEMDAVPDVGRVQELINPTLDSAAIVVLILWNRIGSPSGKAESGTVEEFDRAFERHNQTGWPRMLVYFCKRPADLETADELDQRARVLQFKKNHEHEILPGSYVTPDDFEKLLETHLDLVVDDIAEINKPKRCRKVLYVKVTCLRDQRQPGVKPFYTREVERLNKDKRSVPVFDEAVYYTMEMFPDRRKPTPRVDRSSGVIDPRLVIPFQYPIGNADTDAVSDDPQNVSYEIEEECDSVLTVSHFINGLQGDDQYIASRLTDDVQYIRMIVDFSSVPDACSIVKPGTASLGNTNVSREIPVVAYGDSMYMIYCENGNRGDLLKFNVHFNWPKTS